MWPERASRRETLLFAACLACAIVVFFSDSLFGGKALSPGDVVFVQASFRDARGPDYEPANRLLMDPVLQFQPWLEFNRAMLRSGRLPLWNGFAGCGTPHLSNGQSAVFDPFHLIAYLGTLPDAHAWMAAARLWTAGLGMFLLMNAWGLGAWGRWFGGLAFPFCGFLVAWLLYPVTSVAVWAPWIFLGVDRATARPGVASVLWLGAAVGLCLLGGHVQSSAHVLLAGGLYAIWRLRSLFSFSRFLTCLAATVLGVALAAVEVVPLGFHLAKSPVWADRAAEGKPAWAWEKPRALEIACTAFPYVYGSQRRGQPNLARALGVNNLNEAAGGFAGLAALVWLAPSAWKSRRERPRVAFLAGLTIVGAMGAFGLPPVANLLRAVPVLNVTDNRRLTLWVAFGLTALAAHGIEFLPRFEGSGRIARGWVALWALIAVALIAGAIGARMLAPRLFDRALTHYEAAARETPGVDPSTARARAARQVRQVATFTPLYLAAGAAHLLALGALALAHRRGAIGPNPTRGLLLAATMIDLFAFGRGLNPAIARGDDRPKSPVIAELHRVAPYPSRVVAVGAELPPNLLMRYGLADLRNYDSIELTRSLDHFEPLFEVERGRPARTSRRPITWAGAIRSLPLLRESGVAAVIGASPPPAGAFPRVDQVGAAWVARTGAIVPKFRKYEHGRIEVDLDAIPAGPVVVAEAYDPGWRAEIDGRRVAIRAHRGAFLAVDVPGGGRELALTYDPPEVRWSLAVSAVALGVLIFAAAARKIAPWAWTASQGPVRIDPVILGRTSPRRPTEG